MAIGLLVLLFLMACFFPKSRLLYTLIVLYIWIVFSFNTGAPDRNTYQWIYNEDIEGAFEPLFTFLMTLSRRLNFSYVGFRMLLAALYIMFIHLTYRSVEKYKTFALAMYLLAPFPWQVSGIRAALACSIIMYAISLLIKNPNKNKYKFLFVILLATLVHYSSILFLVLLFVNQGKSSKRIFEFLIIAIIGTIIVLYSDVLINVVSKFTKREKIIGWLTGGKDKDGFPNWKGFAAELLILFGNIFLTFKSKNIISRNSADYEKTRVVSFIYNLNIITILFIPFLRLNDTYARLLIVMHGVNIVSYTMAAYVLQEKKIQLLSKKQSWLTKPKVRFNRFVLIIPLWSYFIAIYQNLPFKGTSMSVLEFLNKMKIF
ncbi:EpsG family protein [Treponema bryantii]|uniref:EpsG family protein n=1 Tax=Treponema bryantii TaxID=163 RepID=A0A1I3N9B0_9SPIR|nr:EpsG family protein [Treponema bryantii]SFJ05757.1 EpsG family protein [Treponema bryantii]